MEDTVTITQEEYDNLIECRKKLHALEGAGVDNMEGYDIAMEMMDDEYLKLNKTYHNHEGKIGTVKVLSIVKHYDDGEEYVVYQGIHTGTIGVIKLSAWNKSFM